LCYQPDDGGTGSTSGAETVMEAVDGLLEKVVTSSVGVRNATFDKPTLRKSRIFNT